MVVLRLFNVISTDTVFCGFFKQGCNTREYILLNTRAFLNLLFVVICFISAQAVAQSQTPIKVALLTTSESQMATYSRLFSQFEITSGIKVEVKFYSDITFRKHMKTWIELGEFDVLYWQAGDRLKKLVNDQTIIPIDELVDREQLRLQYRSSALASVSYHQNIYALPLGQYIWGLYYNKEVFNRLNLAPPRDWQAFKQVNAVLKSNGIKPLVQATQDGWPVLAWLDYFSLDIGGRDYRQLLLEGEFGNISDKQTLLEYFSYLVKQDLFFAPEHPWRWDQAIPALLREQAAMTLLAQFVEGQAQKIASEKIGFIPFPFASTTNNNTEVSPMELLVVAAATTKKAKVAQLIEFIVNYAAVDSIANDLGWLSVSNQGRSINNLSERTLSANRRLAQTDNLVQYFDRETTQEIAQKWSSAIVKSIQTGTIDPINSLELKQYSDLDFEQPSSLNNERLLSLSTIKGIRGSFLLSKILSKVYQSLGYQITITRFANSEASINSLAFGADGELARLVDIPELNKLAKQVPEPIVEATLYLIGSTADGCTLNNDILPSNARLSIIADSVKFHEWAERLKAKHIIRQTITQAWNALRNREIDYILSFDTELVSQSDQLSGTCNKSLESVKAFHYLSNKRADMTREVSQAIKRYKQTTEYKELLRSYGF